MLADTPESSLRGEGDGPRYVPHGSAQHVERRFKAVRLERTRKRSYDRGHGIR